MSRFGLPCCLPWCQYEQWWPCGLWCGQCEQRCHECQCEHRLSPQQCKMKRSDGASPHGEKQTTGGQCR
nr:MAG TPA: hypothetical protein [Caudoviricetes sp.]